ncbi:MAG: hypothetical protein HKN57_13540 [Xanthomonadales bacterium]|nr:hypothetical protein [Gammaproteobacteria bacterium]MBT8053922.1 hypothetical protein [Gammaproteobacteria bacterium]NND58263.1 hypothetical protein [Xanthomonadales bacterium]NNK52026.1 hypothetical protein [Xanthomonadales bacterium]
MHHHLRVTQIKKAFSASATSALLAVLLAAMAPAHVFGQDDASCNPNLDFRLANPGPIFLGDTVRISANLGARDIVGGGIQPAYQDIYAFGYALNCYIGQDFASCESEGNVVEFIGNLSTDCKRPDGTPVELNFPEDNVIEINTVGGPIRTGANKQCNVQFDAKIISLAPEGDNLIVQAMGWPVSGWPATKCSNGLTSAASSTLGLVVRDCAIDIEKEVSVDNANWFPADSPETAPSLILGGTAYYRLKVKNTGTADFVQPIAVVDAALGIDTTIPALAKGQEAILTGDQIEQLTSAGRCKVVGNLENTASASAVCRVGDPGITSSAENSAYLVCNGTPSVDIEKATNGFDADEPTGPQIPVGNAVAWTYVVTNDGELPLTGVAVSDDQGVAVSCPSDTLAVGASMTCTGSGTALAGQYSNVGTVNASSAGGNVSDSDPSHYFGVASSITIEKATNGLDADAAPGPQIPSGDAVTWTYVVTNGSNETLSDVTVTDDQGVTVTCPSDTLAAGASMTCTASGTAVAGQYANIGTATGTPPVGTPVTDMDPSHYFGVTAAIDIEKATNGEDADAPAGPQIPVGDAVSWTYVVTNNSNVALTAVGVTDDQGVTVTCPSDTLAAGASMTCTASGIAVAGQYANIGTATGTPPVGTPVTDTDPSHYFGTGAPSIVIVKEISIDGGLNWSDANDIGSAAVAVFPSDALYRFTVTNNGTASLEDVVIDDAELGITGVNEYFIGNLAVNQTVVITSVEEPLLFVAERCAGRGTFTNTATASGVSAENGTPASDNDAAVLKCIGEPHITIVKEISLTGGDPWYDDITPPQEWPSDAWYRITVTNDGTTPLENVDMVDGDLLAGQFIGNLAVNQSVVLESGQVAELYQEDRCVGAGTVGNVASVSGSSVDDPSDTVDDSDSANLLCVGAPLIQVFKDISVDNVNFFPADSEGDALTTQAPSNAWYRITVKNNGPVDLTNVSMSDGTLGIFDYPVGDIASGQQVVLASGEISELYYPGRCTGKGTFGNTVNVSGESADTGSISTDSDEAWLECTGTPDIQIAKDISVDGGITWYSGSTPSLLPPRDALYRLTVTNTGTTDLDGVVVNDTTLGIVDYPVGYLAMNQTVVLSDGEISELFRVNRCTSAGTYVNTATAEGTSVEWPYGTAGDSDSATLLCGEAVDICETSGRPTRLTLEYNGTYESNNAQGFVGVPDGTGLIPVSPVIVELYDKDQLEETHVGVTIGYQMYVQGFWTNSGKIPPNIKIVVKSTNGETVLQTIKFHGSCSLPLIVSDEFGAVTLVGYKP